MILLLISELTSEESLTSDTSELTFSGTESIPDDVGVEFLHAERHIINVNINKEIIIICTFKITHIDFI